MIFHLSLGTTAFKRSKALHLLIKSGQIQFAGYVKNKIYGKLFCATGKTDEKLKNRVFFKGEQEAVAAGYRPCGNCMPLAYEIWKNSSLTQKQIDGKYYGTPGDHGLAAGNRVFT